MATLHDITFRDTALYIAVLDTIQHDLTSFTLAFVYVLCDSVLFDTYWLSADLSDSTLLNAILLGTTMLNIVLLDSTMLATILLNAVQR